VNEGNNESPLSNCLICIREPVRAVRSECLRLI